MNYQSPAPDNYSTKPDKMQTQIKTIAMKSAGYLFALSESFGYAVKSTDEVNEFIQQYRLQNLQDILQKIALPAGIMQS